MLNRGTQLRSVCRDRSSLASRLFRGTVCSSSSRASAVVVLPLRRRSLETEEAGERRAATTVGGNSTPATFAIPSAAMPSDLPVWATVRLADRGDVPHLHRMIKELAETQRLAHSFSATEASLSRVLFPDDDPLPPFKSFTVLILEVSSSARAEAEHHPPEAERVDPRPTFEPITRRLDPGDAPVSVDPESGALPASSRGGTGGAAAVAAGYVLFFPSLSTFLAKPGFHVEDLFVRAPYRRRGLGRMLLSAVAAQAARMGLGRVEWSVLDWNANAIKFYEDMGAELLPRWRICRLHGDALRSYI